MGEAQRQTPDTLSGVCETLKLYKPYGVTFSKIGFWDGHKHQSDAIQKFHYETDFLVVITHVLANVDMLIQRERRRCRGVAAASPRRRLRHRRDRRSDARAIPTLGRRTRRPRRRARGEERLAREFRLVPTFL